MTDTSAGPSDAMMELSSPDGYYKYLGIKKPAAATSMGSFGSSDDDGKKNSVDEDLVKKNYRRLSLRHHPDKKGGDVDTFRMLNRAQKVLRNSKLRQQYDILGIDLDDETEEQENDNNNKSGDDEANSGTSQGIVHEIASTILASVIHLVVRTAMMGIVAVIVVRYRITILPALLFVAYIAYRIFNVSGGSIPHKVLSTDLLSPILLGLGLILMYQGRHETGSNTEASDITSASSNNSIETSNPESPINQSTVINDYSWSFTFWVGEAIVIGMFIYNSISPGLLGPQNFNLIIAAVSVASILLSLWFRGKFWNYTMTIGLEGFIALFVVVAFPVMEMVLETILNEKLKKAGDKIRQHQKLMEEYYTKKLSKQKK